MILILIHSILSNQTFSLWKFLYLMQIEKEFVMHTIQFCGSDSESESFVH